MRGMISSPNLGLKRKLAEYYPIYNLDEYRTSCINHKTETLTENIYLPDKKGKSRKMHSILTLCLKNALHFLIISLIS
jgi:hypothetical protein